MSLYPPTKAPLFVLLGVIAALAGGGVSFANAASGSGQSLRVRETVTSFAQVDVGPSGLSPGDEAIYRLRIDTPSGTRIGTNNVICTILTPSADALAHCVGTARFADGTLEFAGALSLHRAHAAFAVTGGTGTYDSASGQANLRWLNFPTDTEALVSVQLAD